MENRETDYTGKNIYILSDSRAAIKARDSLQMNSTLVWEYLMKLVEQNATDMGASTQENW